MSVRLTEREINYMCTVADKLMQDIITLNLYTNRREKICGPEWSWIYKRRLDVHRKLSRDPDSARFCKNEFNNYIIDIDTLCADEDGTPTSVKNVDLLKSALILINAEFMRYTHVMRNWGGSNTFQSSQQNAAKVRQLYSVLECLRLIITKIDNVQDAGENAQAIYALLHEISDIRDGTSLLPDAAVFSETMTPEQIEHYMHPQYKATGQPESQQPSYLPSSQLLSQPPSYLLSSQPLSQPPSYLPSSQPLSQPPSYLPSSKPEKQPPSYLPSSQPLSQPPSYLPSSQPLSQPPSDLPSSEQPSYRHAAVQLPSYKQSPMSTKQLPSYKPTSQPRQTKRSFREEHEGQMLEAQEQPAPQKMSSSNPNFRQTSRIPGDSQDQSPPPAHLPNTEPKGDMLQHTDIAPRGGDDLDASWLNALGNTDFFDLQTLEDEVPEPEVMFDEKGHRMSNFF